MYLDINMPSLGFVSKEELRRNWLENGAGSTFEEYLSNCLIRNNGTLAEITVYPHPKHEQLYLDPGFCEIRPGTYYCDRDGIPAESMRQYFEEKEDIGGLFHVGTHSDIAPFLWD
jgi:hypothetical protein